MKLVLVQMTDELLEVIDYARDNKQARNPFLETLLRQSPEIIHAAEDLGIEWIDRPKPGKYVR